MAFDAVLSNWTSVSEREEIQRKLRLLATSSRTGSHVYQNMFSESRLNSAIVKEILESILKCAPDLQSVITAFKQACYRHVLKGPSIKGTRPKVLGRAIAKTRFQDILIKSGMFNSSSSFDAFFRNLRAKTLAQQQSIMQNVPLGRFIVWATFFSRNRSRDPFAHLPADSRLIQDALGLPVESREDDLFLFVYQPPKSLALLFPTIADAGWNDVFSPAPKDAKVLFGQTRPSVDNATLKCQPEIVHSANVTCRHLHQPVGFVTSVTPSI
jgi:hypothetical protein